jgi:PadR family transcriptional regulator, regulatory protein PadR
MSNQGWHEQLRRGALDLAILASVAPEPRYGLEIIRRLEDFTDLVVTEGTVYPILARLTHDGLLEARWTTGESSHPRKYYRLTAPGRRALDDMIGDWQVFTGKIDRLIDASGRSSHGTR